MLLLLAAADETRCMKPFEQPPFAALPERPLRPHDFFELAERDALVQVGGEVIRLRYREVGDGPAVTLVHGLMTSGYSFRYVASAIARRGFRVVVPDLPGAGESEAFEAEHSTPRLAKALAAFLDAVGARGERMIANSMGGLIGMWLALEDPGAMSALVNVHSPVLPIARLRALHFALRSRGARRALERVVALAPERWAHRNVHYRDGALKSREEARVYGAPLTTESGRRAFVSWLGDGLDPAVLRELVTRLEARRAEGLEFPVPLRAIYARTDPMVPPAMGHALQRLVPSAPIAWLDESSHFAHVDTPRKFLRAIEPFL